MSASAKARPAPRPISIDYGPAEADRRADYAGRVMTRNGLPVRHDVAWRIYRETDQRIGRLLDEIRSELPTFKLTPRGVHQAVYTDLKLRPDQELPPSVTMTESGGYSTDHRALCGMVRRLREGSREREVLRRIILIKKAATLRSAVKGYLSPKRLAKLEAAGVAVPKPKDYHVVDGWVHSRYAPTTLNGRYASSKPNIHALTSTMKAVFGRDGFTFVMADADQIHLRIQANAWRIPRLLDVLRAGRDPHVDAMRSLIGEAVVAALPGFQGWEAKPTPGTPAHYNRQTGKVLNYTGAYGGGARTLLAAALKDVDDQGIPTFPQASLAMFQDLLKRRKEREPAWERHYRKVRAEWKANGYLQTEGTGRRFLCQTGKVTDLYNCTVLGFEADLMGVLTWEASQRWPGYLCNQSHDSIVLLVPDEEAAEVEAALTEHMTIRYVAREGYPDHEIPYTGEACQSPTLKEP